MRIGNISGYTNNFGRIYQVVGQKKNMQELRILVADEKKKSKNPAMVYNLTEHNALPKALSEKLDGKQLCVVVTGSNSLKKTNKLSGNDLSNYLLSSRHIVAIGKNVKKDANEILESIKENK